MVSWSWGLVGLVAIASLLLVGWSWGGGVGWLLVGVVVGWSAVWV